MKKIISLILTVCMLFTMVYAASITATAETTANETNSATFDEITVDLSKLCHVGTFEETTATTENLADGGVKVSFSNYKQQIFNADGTIPTSALWMKGTTFALKDDKDNFIILQGGKEYAINVIYEVENVGTSDTTYQPQFALARNNHTGNPDQDNGTVIYTAKKHSSTGTYSLYYSAAPSGNQPLRLAFAGQGTINIKSITIKQVTKNFGTTGNIDLTNVEPISVSSPSYSNFTPATADTPLSLDVNANFQYNGSLMDENNITNTWTKMYLKAMIPLKYDAENYVVLDSTKTYSISVKYKVTATTAEESKDYPKIGIVYNDGTSTTVDNGSKVVAAQRVAPTEVGVEKTLNTTVNGLGLDGHALRLAFTGKGSFEVSSITISECKNAFAVTFNDAGITTVDYILAGEALPTPVKDGATFKGWFDADGVKYTAATKPLTLNALWVNINTVDLTKSVKITGDHGSITVNAPKENGRPLNVKTQGYKNILLDKETGAIKTGNLWSGGAAVSLKFADDTFAKLKRASKYVVNVNYDVTYVNLDNSETYRPQIAIIYNNNPAASNALADNATVIMDVKKHGEAVDNATISCVISGVDANAIRLAFDGVGEFNVNSVTITEITAENDALVMVNLNDSVYSRDEIIVAEKGAAIADLQRTLLHNFGGWYADDVKITIAEQDVTLIAKWFEKADVNMDGIVNMDDLTAIKEAIANAKTDAVYDVDRNSAVNDDDANLIRKNLLGIQSVTIAGNNIRAYALEKGALPFFMTTQATDLLVTSFKEFCGVDIQNTTKATNKIVVSVPSIAQDALDNSALNTLTGVKGDVYGVDDYKIFLYNNDLYIEGGSDYATAFAVNEFISFIQKFEMIPVGFELSGKYNGERGLGEGYSYVWGDEFNGEYLDTTKWVVETGTSSGPCYALNDPYYLSTMTNGNWTYNGEYGMMQDGEVRYLDEEGNNYYLEDGLLVMNTKKTDYGYSATKISAKNKYNFTYGIMTARVKLATKNGASSTFWARSLDNIGGNGASVNEMDFVENYGAEQIRANLHTWTEYVNDTNHSGDIDYQETIYPAEGESLSDTFHEITLYWTADKIVFYFDGVKYLEQDIGSDPEKWEAFYKSTYLIMGVSAPTGIYGTYNNGTTPGDILGTLVDSFNENLYMDYIRVYRK